MLKVLLVEDENLIRRGLAFQMNWTDVGCVLVGEAASGEEGLEQIEALHPDIVITDIRMQDMDGLDMIRRGQEICSFRSIILSGYSEFDYAQKAIRLGVREYLLKPVDMNALRSCLLKAAAQSDPKEASPVTPMTMEELDGSGIKNPYAKEMLR